MTRLSDASSRARMLASGLVSALAYPNLSARDLTSALHLTLDLAHAVADALAYANGRSIPFATQTPQRPDQPPPSSAS